MSTPVFPGDNARACFVLRIEAEHGWAAVTARWTKHTTSEERANDREAWLVDIAAVLQRKLDAAEGRIRQLSATEIAASAIDQLRSDAAAVHTRASHALRKHGGR